VGRGAGAHRPEDNVLDSWIEWLEIDQPARNARAAAQPEALAVLWRGKNIWLRCAAVSRLKDILMKQKCTQGKGDRTDLVAELRSRLGSSAKSASAT